MINSQRMVKKLYVDLAGQHVAEELNSLSRRLELMSVGQAAADHGPTTVELKLSEREDYLRKLSELNGKKLPFRIAQFEKGHDSSHISAIAADRVMDDLEPTGLRIADYSRMMRIVERDGRLLFSYSTLLGQAFAPVRYEDRPRKNDFSGVDVLHYLACNIEQELAFVQKKGDALVYVFDSSRFEKSSKDPETGENKYLGMDLVNFHRGVKGFGHVLPGIMTGIANAMEQGSLDLLTIDLRGNHVYTDGEQQVKRFERDHLVPVRSGKNLVGIIGYADVHFQDVGQFMSPYKGGSEIDLTGFQENFRVMKNGT